MDEIFGLIDSLEAVILEGKKVPFSDKIMVEEHRVLQMIDKMRLVIKSNGSIIKRSIDLTKKEEPVKVHVPPTATQQAASELEAEKIKQGAHEYADYVMANIQLMITKMQTNLVKAEKVITESRSMIDQKLHPKE